MRFVILLFVAEVFGKVAENGSRVGRPAFKGCNAARAAPAVAAFNADDDVLVKEPAVLQKPQRRLGREFIGSKLADTDQIPEPLRLLRFCQLDEGIQSVNFTRHGRFAILR